MMFWNWSAISRRKDITIETILKFHDLPWVWLEISHSPSITMEMIEQNPTLPWVSHSVCQNPNLTMDYIKKHKPYVNEPTEMFCNWSAKQPFSGHSLIF